MTEHTKGIEVIGGDSLPFYLVVWVGNRKKRVQRLALDRRNMFNTIIEITEFLNVRLELVPLQEGVVVDVRWETLDKLDEEKSETHLEFRLTMEQPVAEVYTRDNEKEYPWCCGVYSYEVVYEGKVYYGAFEIIPKNVSKTQLQRIHEVINQHVSDLTLDFLRYKRSEGIQSDKNSHRVWDFLSWYQNKESMLFSAIEWIERMSDSSLVAKHRVEKQPRRLSGRSFRWACSPRGMLTQSSRYLNRRMVLNLDSEPNRLMKFYLNQLLRKLGAYVSSLRHAISELEVRVAESETDIQQLKAELERRKTIRGIAEEDLEGVHKVLSAKQYHHKSLSKRLQMRRNNEARARNSFQRLYAKLQTPFWSQIQEKLPKHPLSRLEQGYRTVYRIWKEAQALNEGVGSHVRVPAAKPTPVLYEYYVFFTVIDVLMKMDCMLESESLSEQLERSFSEEGLLDGTKVTFVKERKYRVSVVYNEPIEISRNRALEKGGYFYSYRESRKPDIRIDCYRWTETMWRYDSSVVIEVKYRPFSWIYSEHGSTNTMQQMLDYRLIMYANGENSHYGDNPNPIRYVICVYPGDNKRKRLEFQDCGHFLQLYPEEDNIVGQTELMELLCSWLEN